jgi:hypothetical protein
MFIPESMDTTEYKEYFSRIYRNRLADLRVDDSRISARDARTFSPAADAALQRIYVFTEKELRGLSPNFHLHVSVSDLHIPTFGLPIFSSRIGRQ